MMKTALLMFSKLKRMFYQAKSVFLLNYYFILFSTLYIVRYKTKKEKDCFKTAIGA